MDFEAATIPALLALRAAEVPDQEALVDHHGRIDYAALDRRSAARAAWLVAQGVNRGHRVGLLMENGVDWAVNAYAVMRIGAVLVPLSTLLRPPELARQLAISGVRHLMAAERLRGRDYRAEVGGIDRAALPALRNVWWAGDPREEGHDAARTVAEALTARVVPADDLAVVFTSGSRKAPRGVIHTHGAAIRAVAAGIEARCVHPGTRLYIPMPFFWIGGFGMGLITALVAGATLLTEALPEPVETLRFLERERATLFRGWPDQAARLARHPDFAATNLSALTDGSLDAVLPAERQAAPGARANLFGMTEAFGSYSGYPLDRDMPEGKQGSCGRPFAGTQLRIGGAGTIEIGGRNLMRGICGLEREEMFTADGWYDTGDMGRIDADGFLWFDGRADDMVKIAGATVYPGEVEDALETIPGVARAFVTDIRIDGKAAIGAAILPAKDAGIDIASLSAAARDRMSAFKLPRRWVLLATGEDVPRNASGKVDKTALKALLA